MFSARKLFVVFPESGCGEGGRGRSLIKCLTFNETFISWGGGGSLLMEMG